MNHPVLLIWPRLVLVGTILALIFNGRQWLLLCSEFVGGNTGIFLYYL